MQIRGRWALGLLAAVACHGAPAASVQVPMNQSFELDSNAHVVAPGVLRISLRGVPEDSRCPTGVQCVWAGRARVRLRVDSANYQRSIDLRTDSASAVVFGHTITLDSLVPYPKSGQTIAPKDYRAWVRVTQ